MITSLKQVRHAVCPYCGVGCRVAATVENETATKISATKSIAPNFGLLCQKGATLDSTGIWDTLGRLTTPLVRESIDDPFRPMSWDDVARYIADRIHAIRNEHGRDAVAFYGSGQLDTEASYLYTKLFKGSLGTNNMDTNSRLCMSSAAAAYTMTFGADAPPGCYNDIQHADLYFMIGSNMADNHPVLFTQMRKRMAAGHARLIVVDPRRSRSAELADLHLPVKPGGDVALVQYLAREMILADCEDKTFIEHSTEGYAAYRDGLLAQSPDVLLDQAGIDQETMDAAVAMFLGASKRLSFYCQGLNQSTRGVDKNIALINLHMQLGEVGQVGSGPFSLTGQPNAMGGREVGYLAHQLPGYRFVSNADHRAEVEKLWKLPPGSIASKPGKSAVEMFDAMARGEIKALWNVCTNPAVSMPNIDHVHAALRNAELVVHQDCYAETDTGRFAHVLLPAAQWGEKTGTMTNSERLIARSEKLYDPPGQAMPDWWIAALIGRTLGFKGYDYVTAEQVWDEHRELTANTPCDQFGITNARLLAGPIHWPCPDEQHPGTPRRYTDGLFPAATGRAKFFELEPGDPDESTDAHYDMILTTGRHAAQWHTRTRSGKVPELDRQHPRPVIDMNPSDAERLGLEDGEDITLSSRRGRFTAQLQITDAVPPRTVFTTFHFGDLFGREANANRLTNDAFDPKSKQPELKYCAVRCEPVSAVAPAANESARMTEATT